MKVEFCLFVLIFHVVLARPDGEKFTTKYDNINVDIILKSDRLLGNYVDCLLGRKTCNKEGQVLKDAIPDALQNQCSKCSEKQKIIAKKVIQHLLQKKKSVYDELEAIYDPQGTYRKQYEEVARKEGIIL